MGFLISSPVSILNYKRAARAASTAPVALSGGATLTIDGVSLSNLDRVLLKNQSPASENGIYEITGLGTAYALARSSDANSSSAFKINMAVAVSEGTVNADKVFQITSNDVIDLNTTAITFSAIEPPAASLVPSQTSQANKVLATDGTTSSWQYAGLGAGSLGTGNIVLGREWPSAFTTGTDVILIGKTATASNGCTDSVIIGQAATAGASPYATIVGDGASAAHSGVAIGRNAAVGGSYSVAVGHGASGGAGAQTVAIGMNASCAGSDSVAIGYGAVAQQNALAIGREANAGATFGMAIGRGSSYTGANSHAMGYGTAAGSGTNGVFIGYGSGLSGASGANNTVVGADSFNGAGLTSAYDNVILGKGVGKLITTAFSNCLIATGAIALTTGDANCIIGDMAAGLASGQLNTAIGFKSTGGGLTGGASQYSSVAIGTRVSCGSNSVAVGDNATASGGTVSVGNSAGNGVTAGVCIGNSSGGYGANNITVVGTGAVARGSTGHGVSIGFGSGGPNANTDVGGYNTCIGTYTGNQLNNPSASSNVFLGYSAGRNNTTQGSTFFLDNQDRTTYAGQQTGSLLYGTFNATASSQTLAINAAVSTPYTIAAGGAITGSNLSGTNTGDNSANSLYTANPMTTAGDLIVGGASGAQGRLGAGAADKVLATDGTTSSWQYAGLGSGGFGSGNLILGRAKPTGLTGTNNSIAGDLAGDSATSAFRLNCFGYRAGFAQTTSSYSVYIGAYAGDVSALGSYNVAVGDVSMYSQTAGISSATCLGFSTSASGDSAVSIGASAQGSGIALGAGSTSGGNASTIVIGRGAVPDYYVPANGLSIGSTAYPIYTIFLYSASHDTQIRTSLISADPNSSAAAKTLTLSGSQGTGTGLGSDVIISTSPAGASGSNTNAYVERLRVTADGKVNVSADLNTTAYTEAVIAIGNTGAAQTLVISSGTVQTATLDANCTFTMPTATAGKSFTLYLRQDGTGSWTATFTSVKWNSTGAPTITVTANKMDILSFVADGTNWYGSYQQGYTP